MDTVTIKKSKLHVFCPQIPLWVKLIFFEKLRKFLPRRVKWHFLFVEIGPVVL